MSYDPSEQNQITQLYAEMLDACTKDGGRKRAAGEKVDWRIDPDHRRGFYSHIYKYEAGDREDEDSGAHPLVHAAWRLLATAWQETHEAEVAQMKDAERQLALREAYARMYGEPEGGVYRPNPDTYDGTNPVFPN